MDTQQQKRTFNSLELKNIETSLEHKEENTISSNNSKKICDSTKIMNADPEEIICMQVDNDIKDTVKTVNCDNLKNQTKEVNAKKDEENSCNVECKSENMDTDVIPLDKDSISSTVENKESSSKVGNNQKRKRKSSSIPNSEVASDDNYKSKRKRVKNSSDKFCWRCHKEYVDAYCTACPRSWHRKCMGGVQPTSVQSWICGECANILRAENAETRSTSMAQLSVDQLCLLLKYVVDRMRKYPGSEPFWKPVELSDAPNYSDYVVKPMDLSLLESNVRAKLYGSTDAFMADAKWIQHNCIVFNTCGGVYTDTSKLTNAAKQIIKMARQEVSEIEACPDCYAHGRNIPRPQPSWFIEACRRPHPLVWAKVKGFPFWPAKAMTRVNSQGFVDVRFFGQHDRAWVAPRDLFLYSEEPPAALPRKRKLEMQDCLKEVSRHCRKLEIAFGQFKFAPPKVLYNPNDPTQIKLMLPQYDPLQTNNSSSPLLSGPKKKIAPKKRVSLLKPKNQATSDSANIMSEDSDTNKKTTKETSEIKLKNETGTETVTKLEEKKIVTSISNNSEILNESLGKVKDCLSESQPETIKCEKEDSKDDKKTDESVSSISPKKLAMKKAELVGQVNDSIGQRKNTIAETVKCLKQLATDFFPPSKNSNENITLKKKDQSVCEPEDDTTLLSMNVQKQALKGAKLKVYKPKTRMVDKVNAERALKSVSAEQIKKLNSENDTVKISSIEDGTEVNDPVSSLTAQIPSSVSISPIRSTNQVDSSPSQASSTTSKNSTDQSVALLLVVNSGTPETSKQSESETSATGDTTAAVQERTKDVTTPQKKENRAKKSFPNRMRNSIQITPRKSLNISSSPLEAKVSMPSPQIENVGYQMVPPEAGPLSARLCNGAQDLARRMAQLMEEAYKEAATKNPNGEDVSENHHATIHFLRLQIERMRWQHQQQLAELKHNTDRILREMRTSLEAERLRAIEETRREAEQEKIRCIEEIKRKQWCAMCGREAVFYCCWNTAYCDYLCQQSHWSTHMRTCGQQASITTIVTNSASNTNQQQGMPKLMINAQHVSPNIWKA